MSIIHSGSRLPTSVFQWLDSTACNHVQFQAWAIFCVVPPLVVIFFLYVAVDLEGKAELSTIFLVIGV